MFPNRGFETFICKYPTVYQWSERFYTLNNNWKVLKQNKLLAVQICSLHEKKIQILESFAIVHWSKQGIIPCECDQW